MSKYDFIGLTNSQQLELEEEDKIQPAAGSWQPMESAPRDETVVLLMFKSDCGITNYVIAQYCDPKQNEFMEEDAIPGWYKADDRDEQDNLITAIPTFWAYLNPPEK